MAIQRERETRFDGATVDTETVTYTTTHYTNSIYGKTAVTLHHQRTTRIATKAALLASARRDLPGNVTPAAHTKGRAQHGDRCLACNRPILEGTRMWTGYDPATKTKTKYHWDHRPSTT